MLAIIVFFFYCVGLVQCHVVVVGGGYGDDGGALVQDSADYDDRWSDFSDCNVICGYCDPFDVAAAVVGIIIIVYSYFVK